MKIYILPIEQKFQPGSQPFIYPAHNADYGVEQDFLNFLTANTHLTTASAKEADWHYLPIFWTRWHLNHNYGKDGLEELSNEVSNKIIDDTRTFTVCQYADGPLVNTGKTKLFLGSRKTQENFDIPLLCSDHKNNFLPVRKKYTASFIGRLSTHIIRQEMYEVLQNRGDIFIHDGFISSKAYANNIRSSYIALSPRGTGGSSYRFYETMQLGTVPLLLGDIDTRPFKQLIPWDKFSFYTHSIDEMLDIIDNSDKINLYLMGVKAKLFYKNNLRFQLWCKFLIEQLQDF